MQQINLYLSEFRPSREPLRAIHMAWSLLLVFILLIVMSVYTHYQTTQLQLRLTQEQQTHQALVSQLQVLTSKKPTQTGSNLDASIQQLQNELQHRQQIASLISSQSLGNAKGFSAQLVALAQSALNTLSLDSFSLQNGGTYAELNGKARSADQIPLYLQKLRADASFAHVGFGVLSVERDEKNGGLLQFSLAKASDKKNKKSVMEANN